MRHAVAKAARGERQAKVAYIHWTMQKLAGKKTAVGTALVGTTLLGQLAGTKATIGRHSMEVNVQRQAPRQVFLLQLKRRTVRL